MAGQPLMGDAACQVRLSADRAAARRHRQVALSPQLTSARNCSTDASCRPRGATTAPTRWRLRAARTTRTALPSACGRHTSHFCRQLALPLACASRAKHILPVLCFLHQPGASSPWVRSTRLVGARSKARAKCAWLSMPHAPQLQGR